MNENRLCLDYISRALKNHNPIVKPVNERGHASVAMLLHKGTNAPEVLFIIRAKHDLDPWSGNIGFPGGRLSERDASPREAAERETREELAFDLRKASFLGQLDDLYGAIMPVLVSCFVYEVDELPRFRLNHEIESTFWCQLPTLLDKTRHQQKTFFYRGQKRTHPVIDLLDNEEPVLWGITYRLIENFFSLCKLDFGSQKHSHQHSL